MARFSRSYGSQCLALMDEYEMKHQQIYQEAAEWIIKIQQATLNETEQAEFEQWKMQSSMHQAAWSKAERLLNSFNTFPDDGQKLIVQANKKAQFNMSKLFIVTISTNGAQIIVPLLVNRNRLNLKTGTQLQIKDIKGAEMCVIPHNNEACICIMLAQKSNSNAELYQDKVNKPNSIREQISRTFENGNGDVFSGNWVQSNSLRNEAGAIDIGITRNASEAVLPIVIDGSLQSSHTFRGYQGESDRTYIDMDLISQIEVEKGASRAKFSVGKHGIEYYQDRDIVDVGPGQEVVNTSYKSDSGIIKAGINITDEHRVEVNMRRHMQKAGEVMAVYWNRSQVIDPNSPPWGYIDVNMSVLNILKVLIKCHNGRWVQQQSMLLVEAFGIPTPSTANITVCLGMLNASYGDQYWGSYQDYRSGINLENTSKIDALTLNYGLTYDEQRMKPQNLIERETARNGLRQESSIFLNGDYLFKNYTLRLRQVNGTRQK
ncbi:hypothetical protein FQR65_LT19154 [Abscondita terminalis]|nr:hypothetical protein FQR65_LT19154 [Abscondita terminalis]